MVALSTEATSFCTSHSNHCFKFVKKDDINEYLCHSSNLCIETTYGMLDRGVTKRAICLQIIRIRVLVHELNLKNKEPAKKKLLERKLYFIDKKKILKLKQFSKLFQIRLSCINLTFSRCLKLHLILVFTYMDSTKTFSGLKYKSITIVVFLS